MRQRLLHLLNGQFLPTNYLKNLGGSSLEYQWSFFYTIVVQQKFKTHIYFFHINPRTVLRRFIFLTDNFLIFTLQIFKISVQVYYYRYFCYLSSSSCRAGSTDIPDPLSPLLPIVHRPRQVFRTTSRILTKLLNVRSCWSSCLRTAMGGGP